MKTVPKAYPQSYEFSIFLRLKNLRFIICHLSFIIVIPPLSCEAQNIVTINGPAAICQGQIAALSAPAGYKTYRWSNNDSTQTINVALAGNYSVTVTDAQNMTQSGSKSLIVNILPKPEIIGEPYVCNRNPTTLSVNGRYPSVKWSTGDTVNQIIVPAPTIITLTAIDTNGCQGIATLVIRDGSQTYNALPDTVRICEGDSIELDATVLDAPNPNDFRYVWLPIDSMMSKYLVRSTDTGRLNVLAIGKCVSYDTVYVMSAPKPSVNFGTLDTAICKGDTVVLKPIIANAASYFWSDGSQNPVLTISKAGNYALTATFGRCRDSSTISVSIFNEKTEEKTDVLSCDSLITLAVFPNRFIKTISWNTNSTEPTLPVTKSGQYEALLGNGKCFIRRKYSVEMKKKPFFDLGKDTLICLEYARSNVVINAKQTTHATYQWQDESENAQLIVKESGMYWAKATNECGSFNDSINITLKECFQIYVPNAFSPASSSGENQVLRLYPSPEVSKIKSFQIFNRWGNLVYSASEFESAHAGTFAWNGYVKNVIAAPDVYVYVVEYFNSRGDLLVKKGDVTVMR
jgi:hypothetical protein